jgi:hypothetical protein
MTLANNVSPTALPLYDVFSDIVPSPQNEMILSTRAWPVRRLNAITHTGLIARRVTQATHHLWLLDVDVNVTHSGSHDSGDGGDLDYR